MEKEFKLKVLNEGIDRLEKEATKVNERLSTLNRRIQILKEEKLKLEYAEPPSAKTIVEKAKAIRKINKPNQVQEQDPYQKVKNILMEHVEVIKKTIEELER